MRSWFEVKYPESTYEFDLIMYKMGISDDDPNTLDVSAVRFD